MRVLSTVLGPKGVMNKFTKILALVEAKPKTMDK